jgi:hypothetical protein
MTRRRAVRDGEETEMNPGLHGEKPKQNREPENVSSGDRSGAATPRRQRESHQARDNVGEKTERERERLNAVPSVSDVGNTLVQAQEPRRGSKLSRRPDKTTHRHTLIAAEKQSTGSRDDALREDKKQINDGASARETESETRRKNSNARRCLFGTNRPEG